MAEKQRMSTLQIICFALGVITGLIIMRVVFEQSGAFAGALGGAGGALLGMIAYALIMKFKG